MERTIRKVEILLVIARRFFEKKELKPSTLDIQHCDEIDNKGKRKRRIGKFYMVSKIKKRWYMDLIKVKLTKLSKYYY